MALRRFAVNVASSLRVRCDPTFHPGFSCPFVRSMSTVLQNLKYAPSHEWVRVEGDVAYVGITDHAQSELGDVVHVELIHAIDDSVKKGEVLAVVESVKAASDVYVPVSGTVLEINKALEGANDPALVNKSPFDEGWFAKLKLTDPSELDTLLAPKAYEDHVAASAH